MDRPFRELHELYRIIYLKAEAQAKAEKEKEEKSSTDGKTSSKNDISTTPSPLEAEALEEVLEELTEGGVI